MIHIHVKSFDFRSQKVAWLGKSYLNGYHHEPLKLMFPRPYIDATTWGINRNTLKKANFSRERQRQREVLKFTRSRGTDSDFIILLDQLNRFMEKRVWQWQQSAVNWSYDDRVNVCVEKQTNHFVLCIRGGVVSLTRISRNRGGGRGKLMGAHERTEVEGWSLDSFLLPGTPPWLARE